MAGIIISSVHFNARLVFKVRVFICIGISIIKHLRLLDLCKQTISYLLQSSCSMLKRHRLKLQLQPHCK